MTVVLPAMAAACGVLSHLAYFIRGEHHKQAILFFKLVVLLPSTVCVVLMHFFSLTLRHAAWLSGSITAAYLGALWTSMIIYRSFFHRLHHFPGPPLAKVSKFYHFFGVLHQAPYRTLEGWHQKYGRIVRIGPAELSIASANAAYAILGPGGCLKSPWYDYGYGQPLNSLHSTRDPAIHEYRRRIWDHGFSSKGKAGALKPPTAPFAHSQIP
jgi:tryprostatin B 6-hydroxylase